MQDVKELNADTHSLSAPQTERAYDAVKPAWFCIGRQGPESACLRDVPVFITLFFNLNPFTFL